MGNTMGPESPRVPLVCSDDDDVRLQVDALARSLCPDGPRPAREIAMLLGCQVVVADLPEGAPVIITPRGEILVRSNDTRSERSIVEACACVALQRNGLDADPESVQDLVGMMLRPVSVKTAEPVADKRTA